MKNKPQHYHLVAGEVLFKDNETEQLGGIKLNTLIRSPEKNVCSRHIGQAQQILQMDMFKKLGDAKLTVIDVFIFNISYLGYMTEEQFTKPPENVTSHQTVPGNLPEQLQ